MRFSEKMLTFVILVSSLTAILYLAFHHAVGDYGVESDFYIYYAPTAHALEHGDVVLDDYHPPLYSWVIGCISLLGIFPGEFEASIFLSIICFSVIVVGTGLVAAQYISDPGLVPIVASALVASNPFMIEMAYKSNVHIFYLAIMICAILAAAYRRSVTTGCFVALAIWTRYTILLSLIPLLFLGRKKWVIATGIVAGAWIALGVFTSVYKGSWLFNMNSLNFAAGLYNQKWPTNPGLWIAAHAEEFKKLSILQIVMHDPGTATMSIFQHLYQYSCRLLLTVLVLPVGLFSIIGFRKGIWINRSNPIILWSVGMFCLLLLTFWGNQFVIALIPVCSISAATQLLKLPFKHGSAIARLILVGVASWGIGFAVVNASPGPIEVKQASQYLSGLPGETVLAKDARVFYYSGKHPGVLEVYEHGAKLYTDYVFYSPWELAANEALQALVTIPNFVESIDAASFGDVKIFRKAGGINATEDPTFGGARPRVTGRE